MFYEAYDMSFITRGVWICCCVKRGGIKNNRVTKYTLYFCSMFDHDDIHIGQTFFVETLHLIIKPTDLFLMQPLIISLKQSSFENQELKFLSDNCFS